MRRVVCPAIVEVTLALLLLFGVTACSSVPDFRPAKPVEEASSLNEALEICSSYQIKADENSAGRAKPARVVVLVPWINCFEKIFRKFPAARLNESYVMFFRALQARHDGVYPADAEVIDPPVMNFVVSKSIDRLRDQQSSYSEAEQREIGRQLPGYAMFLTESGRFSPPATASSVRSRELEDIRSQIEGDSASAGAAGLSAQALRPGARSMETLPLRKMSLNEEQKNYCKKYRGYQSLLYNLVDLSEYRRKLEEQNYADASNPNARKMKERVNRRFSSLKQEAASEKAALDKDLALIRGMSNGFQNGHCLQSGGRRD